jgi:hypothetical protein
MMDIDEKLFMPLIDHNIVRTTVLSAKTVIVDKKNQHIMNRAYISSTSGDEPDSVEGETENDGGKDSSTEAPNNILDEMIDGIGNQSPQGYPIGSVIAIVDVLYVVDETYRVKESSEEDVTNRIASYHWEFQSCISDHKEMDWIVVQIH